MGEVPAIEPLPSTAKDASGDRHGAARAALPIDLWDSPRLVDTQNAFPQRDLSYGAGGEW